MYALGNLMHFSCATIEACQLFYVFLSPQQPNEEIVLGHVLENSDGPPAAGLKNILTNENRRQKTKQRNARGYNKILDQNHVLGRTIKAANSVRREAKRNKTKQ